MEKTPMNAEVSSGPKSVLLYCRPGFEKECAQEITQRMLCLEVQGFVKAQPEQGYLLFYPVDLEEILGAVKKLRFRDLVFARQMIFVGDFLQNLPPTDRVGAIQESITQSGQTFSDVYLETADTNAAKSLSGFIKKFERPLQTALKSSGILQSGRRDLARLHLFFLDGTTLYWGYSFSGNASPWSMGIPRLRFPSGAPSRSTLKLDEAIGYFVREPEKLLMPGMRAVDLGAAPGGWTYQLVARHIRTVAVDNGNLAPSLLESGIVQHVRADGFKYRPEKPVDWLVCDMVEQPSRIAALVGDWFAGGFCRYAIFNLKLPMKKRYECLDSCRALIAEKLGSTGQDWRLEFKQLYHDRAEVTGYIAPLKY
jgi:23S rRNA (cytidine2498-2'-O)-methyltransferase